MKAMLLLLATCATIKESSAFVPYHSISGVSQRRRTLRQAFSSAEELPRRESNLQAASMLEVPSSVIEFPPRWSPLPLRRTKRTGKEKVVPTKSEKSDLGVSRPMSAKAAEVTTTTTREEDVSSSTQTRPTISLPVLTKEQQRMNEMALGAVVGLGVLYVLAFDGDARQFRFFDSVGAAAANIVDTALPATTYEVVSVALGEALAGLTGAIASLGLNLILVNTRKMLVDNRRRIETAQTLINEAVAESDYFLARAAVLPLLEGFGLPPGLATITSSLFATFPYQIVKMGKMKRNARREENKMLDDLLRQQLELEEKTRGETRWDLKHMVQQMRQVKAADVPSTKKGSQQLTTVDPTTLRPVQNEQYSIDGVELFADTCKWLAYAVLNKDFAGTMMWNGQALGTGFESGFYGLLATLTSQIYSDFLYVTSAGGPPAKQEQVRSRTVAEWIQIYISKSISAFTLFGVYASIQLPVKLAVDALLSGSIDSCIGSTEIDVCIETYYTDNPVGADVGEQLRAIGTTLYSFTQIPADYDFGASWEAQGRAIITTLVSLMNQLM